MHAVVMANGSLPRSPLSLSLLQAADLRVGADRGAALLLRLGLPPHLVVGDMDSLSAAVLRRLRHQGIETIRLSRRKNYVDTQRAVAEAVRRGARSVTLLGALGGPRLDHALANILLLAHPAFAGVRLRLVDEHNEAWAVRTETVIEGEIGQLVSLLALTPRVSGIHTTGLEYPLRNGVLSQGSSRGISNALTEPRATVSIRRGLLLVVRHF